MIKLILGNVGSGKTASMVRLMKNNPHKTYITNIEVKGKDMKHVIKLKANMIIKREVIGVKRNGEENIKLRLNTEFWKDFVTKHDKINLIIDEAHIFFNPRRSMSSLNILMTDFLALLRRVLGSQDGKGELILITQLSRRLDIISKEMATYVNFNIHHYKMKCSKCLTTWHESNETSMKAETCPRCKSYYIKKDSSIIETYEFRNIDEFMQWYEYRAKTYFNRYFIKDIEKVFKNYDTLQFNDLLSEY